MFIHYGSPLITAANTALLAVRTNNSNAYRVEARDGATGALLYALPTAYSPPPHTWIPVFGMALSHGTRLYYPGPGGTIYYRDQPDSADGPSGQIAFFGNATYSANQAAFDSTVAISTPIAADSNGNIYFGFDVTGPNPENLTSGLARIAADGSGSWISASAAAQGDARIVEVAQNCAPALSNDGATVYFAVSQGPVGMAFSPGYLVALRSDSLAPIARVRLLDPQTGNDAMVSDQSSASPVVGPDNDVYYGVFESGVLGQALNNDDRGWLLHFDASLTVSKTPGAFGWDDTPSLVPASLVPSYTGTSPYLLFSKYNNYMGDRSRRRRPQPHRRPRPGCSHDGPDHRDGRHAGGAHHLRPDARAAGNPNGSVREWCINSGAIDPFTGSALANSEDGTIYRWDFASNSFPQQVRLTGGVGEAYTPTAIGVDGTVYAINDAILFAVGQASRMTIVSTHTGDYVAGQSGATYTLTATNSGAAPTSGAVSVSDTLPPSLTAQSIAGEGWSCTQPAGPCSRADSLAAGASYAPIVLTVNVAADSPPQVVNQAQVSADGVANSINSTSNDSTNIRPLTGSLSIAKGHSGNFTQGQVGATYTVRVTNNPGAGAIQRNGRRRRERAGWPDATVDDRRWMELCRFVMHAYRFSAGRGSLSGYRRDRECRQ
ncbi:MAG: hypothetical protein WDO73_35375 [Ignavibacteriota bacterium]